ncbi:hypothetical protein GCM10010471_25510 [Leucobacter komagatae]
MRRRRLAPGGDTVSIEIRANVRRLPRVGGTPKGEPWFAVVYTVSDSTETGPDCYETTWSGSLPEAIQAVYLMRANIERQLMDEVHASRASRRDLSPAFQPCNCDECASIRAMHKALNA